MIYTVYRPPIRRIEGENERECDKVRYWLVAYKKELILGYLNLHAKVWCDDGGKREDGQAKDVVCWCEENEYVVLDDGSKTCIDRGTGGESTPDVSLASKEVSGRCKWEVLNH